MKKIILFLLSFFFISQVLYAATPALPTGTSEADKVNTTLYTSDFPIYVKGDVNIIRNSFEFIAVIVKDTEFIDGFLMLAGVVLAMISGYSMYRTLKLTPAVVNALYFSAGIMSLNFILVDVHIEDQRTNINSTTATKYAKVEGVPFPIALMISASSTLSLHLTSKVEDATLLSDASLASASSIGFANSFNDLQQMIRTTRIPNSSDGQKFEEGFVEYMSTCILEHAYYEGHNEIMKDVLNPDGDIIDVLNPVNYGIQSKAVSFIDGAGTAYDTCQELHGYLVAKRVTIETELITNGKKGLESDGSDDVFKSIATIGHARIGANLSGPASLGQFKAFMLNVAALKPLSKSIRNSSGTTYSGQDLANSITFESSKAQIQAEGAGQFKWMAQIMPMGFHFLLAITYACSIFVLLFAVAFGFEKGFGLIANYAQGLISFEFINVAMELASNSVNEYSYHRAADHMAAMGNNPATLENINGYMDYLATMAGIAGILGVAAIFFIPTIVFTGKVAVAAGALNGLGGRYKGNDIETAESTISKQKASAAAHENAKHEAMALRAAGYDVEIPDNMGMSDYYNKLQGDISSVSKGMGASLMSEQKMLDAGKADMMGNASSITQSAYVGNNTDTYQHVKHGATAGASFAGQIEGSAKFVDDNGGIEKATDILKNASRVSSLKEKYGQKATAEHMNDEEAKNLGYSSATTAIDKEKQTLESRQKQGLLDKDGNTTQKMLNAFKTSEDLEAAKFAGMGDTSVTDDKLKKIREQSSGQIQQSVVSAETFVDKTMKDGKLTKEYEDAIRGSEASKYASMIEATKTFGSPEKQEDFAKASTRVKTASDMSVLENNLTEAGKKLNMSNEEAEKLGKTFGRGASSELTRVADKLASTAGTKAGAQTSSDIASIKTAGGRQGYISLMTKSATEKTDTLKSTINAKEHIDYIDENGNLSDLAKSGVAVDTILKNAPLMNKAKLNASPKTRKNLLEAMAKSKYGTDMTNEEFSKYLKDEGWENFENMTTEEFSKELYSRQGGVLSSNAKIAGKDGAMYDVSYSEHGATATRKTGTNSVHDDTAVKNIGEKTNIVSTDPAVQEALAKYKNPDGTYNFKKAGEWLKTHNKLLWDSQWKNQLSSVAASFGVEYDAEGAMSTLALTGSALGGAFAIENASKFFNQKEIPQRLEDLQDYKKTEDGKYADSKGNKFTLDSEGRVIDSEGKFKMKANPYYESGWIKKGYSKLFEKGKKDSKSVFSVPETFNSTTDETTDVAENANTDKSDKTANDEIHSNSSGDNKKIIPQNENKAKYSSKEKEAIKEKARQEVEGENAANTKKEVDAPNENSTYDNDRKFAMNAYLDARKKYLQEQIKIKESKGESTGKLKAKIEKLEDLKDTNLDSLSIGEQDDIGYDSEAKQTVNSIVDKKEKFDSTVGGVGDNDGYKGKNKFAKAIDALSDNKVKSIIAGTLVGAGAANAAEVGEAAETVADVGAAVGKEIIASEINSAKDATKLINKGGFANYMHGVTNFFTDDDTGNAYAASVKNFQDGNYLQSLRYGGNAVANFVDMGLTGATDISNILLGTSFKGDYVANFGTDYMKQANYADAVNAQMNDLVTAQMLTDGIQKNTINNNNAFQGTGSTFQLQSAGGAISIGQNNDRMLRINGMQTSIPYSNFQKVMNENPNYRQQWAESIAGMNIPEGSQIDPSINNIDTLQNEMMNRFNIQETYTQGQSSKVSSIAGYSADIQESIEEFTDQIEQVTELQESIEEINQKIDG